MGGLLHETLEKIVKILKIWKAWKASLWSNGENGGESENKRLKSVGLPNCPLRPESFWLKVVTRNGLACAVDKSWIANHWDSQVILNS